MYNSYSSFLKDEDWMCDFVCFHIIWKYTCLKGLISVVSCSHLQSILVLVIGLHSITYLTVHISMSWRYHKCVSTLFHKWVSKLYHKRISKLDHKLVTKCHRYIYWLDIAFGFQACFNNAAILPRGNHLPEFMRVDGTEVLSQSKSL